MGGRSPGARARRYAATIMRAADLQETKDFGRLTQVRSSSFSIFLEHAFPPSLDTPTVAAHGGRHCASPTAAACLRSNMAALG